MVRLQTITKLLFKSFERIQKRHFNNLNVKDATENKRFWKTIKPFFTEKTENSNNIILTENYQTIRESL